jgi:hypothetical protein
MFKSSASALRSPRKRGEELNRPAGFTGLPDGPAPGTEGTYKSNVPATFSGAAPNNQIAAPFTLGGGDK